MADRFGTQKAIDEFKEQWLESILIYLGVDIHIAKEVDSGKFLDILANEHKLDIIEYPQLTALCVKKDEEMVGELVFGNWTLKEDSESGSLYYQIEVEAWSLMEEDIDTV